MAKFFSLQFQVGLIVLVLLAVSTALTSLLTPGITVAASGPGFGVIGDSNTDEYRADDNQGGFYAATTLNWVEQLVAKRGLQFGPWGSWGEPRRSGFKYNWARSGATAESMIRSGQHLGLAQQVAAGEVGYAFIFVGSNDFHVWNGTYQEIYDGSLSDSRLQAKINRIISSITTAVDTLQGAGNVKIVLANYADPGMSPEFQLIFPDQAKRQRVTGAILAVNESINNLVASRKLVLADLYGFASALIARRDANGNLMIAGELIQTTVRGDEPHHLQLNDKVGHLGTIGSGLWANLFMEALARGYNVNIPAFSEVEILQTAGIPVSEPTPAPTATVEPAPAPSATANPIFLPFLLYPR
jgi:phospholipase/lecithinase/hemolysin